MDKEIKHSGELIPLIKNDGTVGPLITKMVRAYRTVHGIPVQGSQGVESPHRMTLEKTASRTAEAITDAMTAEEILPDIELAKQVLVSSIISPQDMISNDVNFDFINNELPAEFMTVKDFLDKFFKEEYPIKDVLPKALEAALFTEGAYVITVIPETGLDSLINHGGAVTLEEYQSFYDSKNPAKCSLNILGPSRFSVVDESTPVTKNDIVSLEDFDPRSSVGRVSVENNESFLLGNKETKILVTDNFNTLKIPVVIDRLRRERVERAYMRAGTTAHRKLGMESSTSEWHEAIKKLQPNEREKVMRQLYADRAKSGGVALKLSPVDSYSRKTKGHGLPLRWPTESLIPAFVPGSPDQHVGYFGLLDEFGNPLHTAKGSDKYREMQSKLNNPNTASAMHGLLNSAHRSMFGSDIADKQDAQAILNAYTTIVEEDLTSRVFNGAYKTRVELKKQNEFYRIMLSRQLANMGTQILFIPAEQVTYFAFDYNADGVGRSLLDKSKLLTTMRSVLMFANTMASVRKATPGVNLKIQLDPDEQNPAKQVEMIVHEYARTKATSFPLTTSQPYELVNYVQNANTSVTVAGNPNYPETEVTTEERQQTNAEPDVELEESLRRKHFQSFSLSPELIDGASQVEFAQSILTGNLLMAKRVTIYQSEAIRMLNDHIRKFIFNSGKLTEMIYDELKKIVCKLDKSVVDRLQEILSIDDTTVAEEDREAATMGMLFNYIVYNYTITLPAPDIAKFESQVTALEAYVKALDIGLPAYITEDVARGLGDDVLEGGITALIASIKAYAIREWLRKNNMLRELEDIIPSDASENGSSVAFDAIVAHQTAIQKAVRAMAEKIKDNVPEDEQSGSGGYGGGDDTGSDTNDEFGGGGDEFDTGGGEDGFDMGSTDTTAEEETTGEESEETPPTEETPPAEEETPAAEEETPPAEEKKEEE